MSRSRRDWSCTRRRDGHWRRWEYGGHIGGLASQHTRPLRHYQRLELWVCRPRWMHSSSIQWFHGDPGIAVAKRHAVVEILNGRLMLWMVIGIGILPAGSMLIEGLLLMVVLFVIHMQPAHVELRPIGSDVLYPCNCGSVRVRLLRIAVARRAFAYTAWCCCPWTWAWMTSDTAARMHA
jgi:hypothetical protein